MNYQENKMGTHKILPLLLSVSSVLENIFGLNGVWISFLIAEGITAIYSLIVYKYHSKKDVVLKLV